MFSAGIPETKRRKGSNKGSNKSKSGSNEDSLDSCEFDVGQIKAEFGVTHSRASGGNSGGGSKRAKDDGDEKAFKKRLE